MEVKIKMKKTAIFSLLALIVVGMIFSASMVSAYRGDYSVEGPDCNEEKHELMEEAFETLDYNAWSGLMAENGRHSRVMDVVTEDNFETFVQAHEEGVNGNHETASVLRAELGLNDGNGPKDGTGFGKEMRQGRFHHRMSGK